ncbi:MAG: hypothetical protein QXP65_00090 [Candidatus Hadarchaeales archaeon]
MSEVKSDLTADLLSELRHKLNELERRLTAIELAMVNRPPNSTQAPEARREAGWYLHRVGTSIA